MDGGGVTFALDDPYDSTMCTGDMYELMVVFIPDESYRGWVLEQAHGKVAPSLVHLLSYSL